MSRSFDTKAQLWTKRFREFEASSLSVAQFCQSVGCSSPTFYQWRRKLAGFNSAKSTTSAPASRIAPSSHSAFLQVQTKSDCSIQVKLLSGVVISLPIEALDYLPQILNRIA
jgi:transposase-like protein